VIEKLPEVEVDSGEKDEKQIWAARCALYRFAPAKDPPEWVTRGIGDIRFLKHEQTGVVRMVLREDKTWKLRLNHFVHPNVDLKTKQGMEDRAWTWTASDYTEDENTADEVFCVKFKTPEMAQDFKKAYDAAKETNKNSSSSSSSAAKPQSSPPRKEEKKSVLSSSSPAASKSIPAQAISTGTRSSGSSNNLETRAKEAEELLVKLNQRLAGLELKLGLTQEKKTEQKIVFGYWDIRGLAQPIRHLFAYLDVKFEDKRYHQGGPPSYDRSEWTKEKFSLGLPFPNLPYLIVDNDVKLTQSHAIFNYLVKSFQPSLYGTTAKEAAEIDMILGVLYDWRETYVELCYGDYEKELPKYRDSVLPNVLKLLTSYLQSKGNRWINGEFSLADFVCSELLDQNITMVPQVFQNFSNLKSYVARFQALPRIAAYMKSKDFISRPFNNSQAKFK